LLVNVENAEIFLKRFVKFVSNIVAIHAISKFQLVRAVVSKLNPQTVRLYFPTL